MRTTTYRQTITQAEDKADDMAMKMATQLMSFKEGGAVYSWVDISPSIPVYVSGRLHYTITITAGTDR